MKNIVIVGGGTGTSTLLKGLKNYPANLSVVVSSWDDGGSNGRLRKELKSFPYSDVRQCLVALSNEQAEWKDFFEYRFSEGELKGHTAANLLLAGLQKITGSVEEPIEIAKDLLKVRGNVYPATLVPTTLIAKLSSGKKVIGEHNIDEPNTHLRFKIEDLRLSPTGPANPKALKAIKEADVIVFGPGDLYTSIVPNLLVRGMSQAVNASAAKKVLVTNIMSKYGQTDGFQASDFARVLASFLKGKIDVAVINNKAPSTEVLKKYRVQKAKMVRPDLENLQDLKVKVIAADFASKKLYIKDKSDVLLRSLVRHDSKKLAKIIYNLV